MKILVLTNNFGGLHSFREEVMKALVDAGHNLAISAPFDEKKTYFEEIGCKLIDTQFNRKGTNPLKDFGLMVYYSRLMKRLKPDVVLSYTIKPNLYGGMACQLCHVPQIANITGLGSAVENPGWLQKLTILLYKIGLRKTHLVFFQNKANKEFCEKHEMVKGTLQLLPGSGVNLEWHALQEYPLESEPVRFIFISRLLREKGIEEYLGAAERIKVEHHDIEFLILGVCEEKYEEQIKALQERGIIIYHGPQKDVRPFIGKAWCTIHPSFYPEGMSNVLLESCAAGRPIITTNRPGCAEIVEDGKNGYIVEPRDIDDLVEKIKIFLALQYDQKKQMGLEGRKKVEKEFDRQIVIDHYLDAINQLGAG